jgi:hypothetical protein
MSQHITPFGGPPPDREPPVIGPVPHYQGGRWDAGTDWIDHGWLSPPPRGEQSCAVRGYYQYPLVKIGTEYGLEIYLWRRQKDVTDVPPALILIVDEDRPAYLSAASLPEAMDLVARWAPAVTAKILTDLHGDLTDDSTHNLLTDVLGIVRANEHAIEERRRAVIRSRQIARERRAQRAGGAS